MLMIFLEPSELPSSPVCMTHRCDASCQLAVSVCGHLCFCVACVDMYGGWCFSLSHFSICCVLLCHVPAMFFCALQWLVRYIGLLAEGCSSDCCALV